ncbi:MAG: hypothetical protein JSU06_06450 [Actinobacteria bacterium]|nr:hypothetical protein [Actinomycetota bacterium]
MGRGLVVTLLVALGLAVAPAAATAQDLYTTPSPALGATCAAESPCGLSHALSTAVSGDTVVIGAGTYEPEATYSNEGKSLTIEGAVIGTGRPVVTGNFVLTGAATRISDVEIYSGGIPQALRLGERASANRVMSVAKKVDGCQIESSGGRIANSVCATESNFFSGLSTQERGGSGPMTVRNVTMIGHIGFYSGAAGVVSISDSIAMRNASSGEDASLGSGATNLLQTYALHQSGTPLSQVEPLTQEPIFLNPGAWDYREAANSPSIDAGATTVEPGELDLNGNLRKIGAKTDLGAYEFVPEPPSAGTPSATRISPTSVSLSAAINPNSGQTYYHFEYGPSAAYGSSTPTFVLPAATTPANVQVELTGLPPNSITHYSVVASSDGGVTTTPDATFDNTPPSPIPPPAPAPPTVSPPPGKLSPILRFKQSNSGAPKGQPLLDRSSIKLSTGCGPAVACNVSVEGQVKVGAKLLGTLPGPKTPSHWQAGKQGAIKLRVSPALQHRVRAYLEANPTARAKIFVTATYATAEGGKATRKLTIPVRPV